MKTKDCIYPDCVNCDKPDCDMDDKDIVNLKLRLRRRANAEAYRATQNRRRARIRANLPHCDECGDCILVKNDKGVGFRRLCIREWRLVEQKVSNSPQWCKLRENGQNRKYYHYQKKNGEQIGFT